MATILDLPLLEFLMPIFVFLFIFVAGWALLMKSKYFGEHKGVSGFLAFILGVLFFMFPAGQVVVSSFVPWMIIIILLVITIFIFFMFLGVKEKDLANMARKNGAFITTTIIVVIFLFLLSLGKAFGPFLAVDTGSSYWVSFKRVVFHPKMVGILLIITIASFTMRFLSIDK